MGHIVRGILAREPTAERLRKGSPIGGLRSVPLLDSNLVFFPITDDLQDALWQNELGIESTFVYYTPALAQLLVDVSLDGPIAYFETEYHGGSGTQSAVAYDQKKIVSGPMQAHRGPINEALRALGVECTPPLDEFDTVGLGRFRDTESWYDLTARPMGQAGDYYVVADCCTTCGIPWLLAPDLFNYDGAGCWVMRQPQTLQEKTRMTEVVEAQELGCIRYRGDDPTVLPQT